MKYSKILALKKDFPILDRLIHQSRLVYLDNAATSQKPQTVIDSIAHFYQTYNSNVHRSIHTLSLLATSAFEQTRSKVQQFINARKLSEIVFVRGSTEAINLVAYSYGRSFLKAGDEILISTMEHHSNIVPWQMLCQHIGAILKVIPITLSGDLDLDSYQKMLSGNPKLVAITHVSNTLGTINPIKKIIDLAHENNAVVLIDGAQSALHLTIDVQALDCDFYSLSGHKMLGPNGVGVLYGKQRLLEMMPPFQGGGDMIESVSFSQTTYRQPPYKFEAGTPAIADVIGLGTAIDYLNQLDYELAYDYEQMLLYYTTQQLSKIKGLRLIGTSLNKIGIISFVIDHIHPHDLATILDTDGVAVRGGHHCTMPLMDFYHLPATVRASLTFYNSKEDIDIMIQSLHKAQYIFN